MSDKLTADDAIMLLGDTAQQCREEGEGDMRIIVHMANSLSNMIHSGKSRQEILDYYKDEEEG